MHLRENKERAQAAIAMLWIIIVLTFLQAFSGYLQYDLLLQINSGVMPTDAELEANDLREQIINIIYAVFIIISAITFISWFRRAYFNLSQIYPNKMFHAEGWAAGAWFVPIMNLYVPFQIMKELYTKTEAYFKERGVTLVKPFNNTVIMVWWLFWIIGSIMSRVSSKLIENAETVEKLIDFTLLNIITALILLIGAFFALMVVRNYASNEEKLRSLRTEEIKVKKEAPQLND